MVYFFAPLRVWDDTTALERHTGKTYELTPIYFWTGWVEKYFYMTFKLKNDCSFAGIANDSNICKLLKSTFLPNSILNVSLILGFLLTSSTICCLIWMMFGHFFRFTNFFCLLSGLNFIAMGPVWYLMVSSWTDPATNVGAGLFFIPLAGLSQLLCYTISRWYTNKLYDAHFINNLLDCSDVYSEPSETEDNGSEASEIDSVLASVEQKKSTNSKTITDSVTHKS